MADTRISKSESSFRKANLYKDATMNALKEVTEFDSKIINSNDRYLETLKEADSIEYEILRENMAKAETEVERQAIRDRMAEMKKERYQKDTENKEFYEKQQNNHKNYTLQILTSVAAVVGVINFRKPIMDIGKKLITKR